MQRNTPEVVGSDLTGVSQTAVRSSGLGRCGVARGGREPTTNWSPPSRNELRSTNCCNSPCTEALRRHAGHDEMLGGQKWGVFLNKKCKDLVIKQLQLVWLMEQQKDSGRPSGASSSAPNRGGGMVGEGNVRFIDVKNYILSQGVRRTYMWICVRNVTCLRDIVPS